MNFIKELEWRGMIHDMIPGTEEALQKTHFISVTWWAS